MTTPHITVALNVHSETIVSGPTIRSAEEAVRYATAQGYTVDRLLGVDRGTAGTKAFFSSPHFANWRYCDLDEGDLGQARNRLIEEASDGYIAFLDADDLYSENWLVEAVRTARTSEAGGHRACVHPELRWTFEQANTVAVNIPSSSPLFLKDYLRVAHTYDSLILAHRQTFLDIPYRSRDHAAGFGYEDWAWTLDSLKAGVDHVIASDTIIFKRRRESSLLSDLSAKKSLLWPHEANAIDHDWAREA